jgi:hypothetical protein
MVRFSDGGKGFEGRAPRATKAQLKVREDDQKAVEAKQARKKATRQKIVIGGALMALADAGNITAQQLLDQIQAGLPPRDLAAFKD